MIGFENLSETIVRVPCDKDLTVSIANQQHIKNNFFLANESII